MAFEIVVPPLQYAFTTNYFYSLFESEKGEGDLIVFEIDPQVTIEKEMYFDNSLYDIVSVERKNNVTIVKCIKDEVEDCYRFNFSKFFHLKRTRQQHHNNFNFLCFCGNVSDEKSLVFPNSINSTKVFNEKLVSILAGFTQSVFSPPDFV
jgi:hypothetical protein